ncbi:MAG: hypothetical protein M1818_007369 [Claussenomyces sp. TS43310]|nr:MAG: hypothetical protein M1818_007369 [Claussenomyces sp. TS43310]
MATIRPPPAMKFGKSRGQSTKIDLPESSGSTSLKTLAAVIAEYSTRKVKQPMTDYLGKVTSHYNISSLEQVICTIRDHVERNNVAHPSALLRLIVGREWVKLASQICDDYHATDKWIIDDPIKARRFQDEIEFVKGIYFIPEMWKERLREEVEGEETAREKATADCEAFKEIAGPSGGGRMRMSLSAEDIAAIQAAQTERKATQRELAKKIEERRAIRKAADEAAKAAEAKSLLIIKESRFRAKRWKQNIHRISSGSERQDEGTQMKE